VETEVTSIAITFLIATTLLFALLLLADRVD
jgi:hypothetical protein